MTEYRVTWEIDVDADSPEEAARKALAAQRRPLREDGAHVFTVKTANTHPVDIDLDEIGETSNPDNLIHVFRTFAGIPPTKGDKPICGAALTDAYDFAGSRSPCPECQARA